MSTKIIFRDVMPCSLKEFHQCFEGIYCLHPQGLPCKQQVALCFDYFLTIRMETARSCETTANLYQSTRWVSRYRGLYLDFMKNALITSQMTSCTPIYRPEGHKNRIKLMWTCSLSLFRGVTLHLEWYENMFIDIKMDKDWKGGGGLIDPLFLGVSLKRSI